MNTGYIVIPNGVDRQRYVNSCYKRLRVAVLSTSGASFFNECIITKEALANVKFPLKPNELGTPVVYIEGDYPLVIGTTIAGDEVGTTYDGLTNIREEWGECIATVSVDTKEKVISIDIQDQEPTTILIKARGSENSKIAVETSGEICVKGSKLVNIESSKEVRLSLVNSKEKINTNISLTESVEVEVKEKFTINKGEQPMVRGKELTQRLKEVDKNISTLKSAMQKGLSSVKPQDGGASAFAAMVSAVGQIQSIDFEEINSKVGYIE